MYSSNLVKAKTHKKRNARSNGQKDYEERKSKLFNLGTSPMNNFKVSNCKPRVQSINFLNHAKKMDMSTTKNLKISAKYPRYNIRAKVDTCQNPNDSEVSKSHSFKLLRKSNAKNKSKDRRSLSGSNKTGRPTTGQPTTIKKKIKTIKGKPLETKDNGGYF